ncbi:MAG: plasmid mobilization relaxosome protein MobC [Clostridia bacterium]|nr:plasmid mobilization relaxosome protein MobC [Clostridia bacterium]
MNKVIKQTIRLTEKQHLHLKIQAQKSGLKMEPYVRKLIMGFEVKARPPNEYAQLVKEVNAIGNNINQIAHIANATGTISQTEIDIVKKNQNDIMRLVKGLR